MQKSGHKVWNPYISGALSGLLLIVSVLLTGNYFGASTSFVNASGIIERIITPEHFQTVAYFTKNTPKIDWQWMFVVGIFIGALIASLASGSFRLQAVPDMWRQRFKSNVFIRPLVAFSVV